MSIITIVGAGMMGSAMCFPACDNGHEVRIVGIHNRESIESVRATGYHTTLKATLPEGVKAYHIEELDEALEGADLVISGVSSFGAKWFEETVLPKLPEGVPVLSVTKGLEADEYGNLTSFPQGMMKRAGKPVCICAIGGPVISFELAARKQTEIAFCGPDMEMLEKIKGMLATDYYHISLTKDIAGLECAVAMKNAYALGVALAIGLNEKENGIGTREYYNPQAALFEESMREAIKLIQMMGGGIESIVFFGGDLYVTVFGGRTRKIGTLLGRGLTYPEAREVLTGVTLESVAIATLVAEALRKKAARGEVDLADFPLLKHIDEIINQGKPVSIPWTEFEKVTE